MDLELPKILLIEDDETDVLFITNYFSDLFYKYDLMIARSLSEGMVLLDQNKYILILSSLTLNDAPTPRYILEAISEKSNQAALVLLTTVYNSHEAIKFIENGAQDYLVKGELTEGLVKRVIEYAIERRRNKIELEEMNKKLQSLSELKSEFVSMVSHELRSPLTYMNESIEILKDKSLGDINEKQHEALEMLKNGINRLLSIINDLLDISKIEAGKLEISLEEHDFSEVVHICVEQMKGPYQSKGVELIEILPKGSVTLNFDRGRIIQVFVNLLSNALKFTDKGKVEVGYTVNPECIECFVIDSGRGISASDVNSLFKQFEQFGSMKTGKEKGTGLGLNICKKLIELHGGQIRADSIEGKGSKFFFTIPRNLTLKKVS